MTSHPPETPPQKLRRLRKEERIRARQLVRLRRVKSPHNFTRRRAVRARLILLRHAISHLLNQRQFIRPHEIHVYNVANQSARTAAIQLIVLHDTEGGTLESVAELFNRPANEASAHVGVAQDGASVQYVPDSRKAWHVAEFNSVALGIEQLGFSTETHWPEAQLFKTAQYVAYWARRYGIPLVHSTEHGVCQHKDLGNAGGGHGDCGPNYPFEHVLALARGM